MGDSITDNWEKYDADFFKFNPFINRGISGQTTTQMLVRFRADVIDLQPKVVVIHAGTNDIAGNRGEITLEQIAGNIFSMAELAKANGIEVVLAAVLPAIDYSWRPGREPAEKIVALNQMIESYAKKNGIVYVDYYSSMVNDQKGLKKELGRDTVHPSLEGYLVMEPLVKKGIEQALKQTKQTTQEVLYQDDFEGDLSNWVVEQMPGGTVRVIDGKLEIEDNKGCTVWFKKKLEGPVMIEYDAFIIKEGGPHDRGSDLNCFWMAQDMQNYDNLFAGSEERGGKFTNYDPLRLYYVGYGANHNSTTRFRRYVGTGQRPVLPEHDLSDEQYMLKYNVPIKIQLIADGERIAYLRDGEVIYDIHDPKPYTDGWFGFRTVDNHLTFDNFKVYRIKK
jgi:lysophospholipase L1-like esterase